MKAIIHKTKSGISITIPAGGIPIEEVARKDVPAGVPYKIVDAALVPTDRTFRAAWDVDMSNPDGVGMGAQAWFIEQYQKEITEINALADPGLVIEKVLSGEEIGLTGIAYDKYVNRVERENMRRTADHPMVIAEFNEIKAARIAQLNQMIEVQRREMTA